MYEAREQAWTELWVEIVKELFQLEWGSTLQSTTGILLNKLTELTLFLIIYLTKFTMVHINYTYRMPSLFHYLSTTKDGLLSWVGFG